MSLATDRFLSQTSGSISYRTVKQVKLLKLEEVLLLAHIHGNGIDRIRAGTLGIP
jgi:hypothetical protein